VSLNYYPAFINLREKQCVVVGGGKVAERKVLTLIRSGAKVKVISPAITGILERYKQEGRIRHIKRNYKKGDLNDAFLVIAATSDEEINRKVSVDAPFLVNAVDMPEMANFIVPSVINRGLLTIAISTSGASPAIAKAIRKELEMLYGREFGQFLFYIKSLRGRAMKEISDKRIREGFLKGIASEEIFELLRKKGFRSARKKIENSFIMTEVSLKKRGKDL
jgi:precorrin-2 dehydrogenase/sirohydrochlorin ferrochelatase